jgi:uncharacterized protein
MLRLIAFLIFFPLAALAQSLPDPLSDTVSDFANILPPDVEARISDTLAAQRQKTGVHIVVVTMASIKDYGAGGQSIEAYAKTLFNRWGIGDAKRNDGVMILVASNDRRMRIELGRGFDAAYDGRALRVIDTVFLPEFRKGHYETGIEAGVAATIANIAQPFATGRPLTGEKAYTPQSDSPGGMGLFAVFAFGAIALLGFRSQIADGFVRLRACPQCGAHSLGRTREVSVVATEELQGSGISTIRCSACGYESRTSYTISRVSSSSSGSGGFGGGSSSGGGASGKW